jgi:hypothetical protein
MTMTTTRTIVVLLLLAGASRAVAAQDAEPRTVEKRVIVSADSARGHPTHAPRGPVTYLGVAVAPADPTLAVQLQLPEGRGLVVKVVEPDSPAAKAGLQQHDVLTKLEDQILIDPRQLAVLVRGHKEGEKITLTYMRAGAEARATATLATHVPGPEPAFQWLGRPPGDVFFHAEKFGSAAEAELIRPGSQAEPFQLRVGPGSVPHREWIDQPADRVMIFRPQAGVVYSDESGTLEMQLDEEGQVLTAKDANGKVVFSGPITTPEQRAALPEDLRKRLEKFESLDVVELPGPMAGAVRVRPGERLEVEHAGPIL